MADNLNDDRNLRQEIVDLLNQASRSRQEEISLSATLVESIKEALNITRGRNTTDSNLLNVNRDINRTIINQKEGLSDINDITKQITKNNDIITKAQKITNSLSQNVSNIENDRLNISRQLLEKREKIDKLITEEIAKAEAGQPFNEAKLKGLIKQAEITDELIAQDISQLNSTQQQILLTEANTKALERQNAERNKELQLAEAIKAAEGLTGKAVGTVGRLLGLNSDTQNQIKKDAQDRLKALQDEGKLMDGYQGKVQGLQAYAKSFGTNFMKAVTDPVAILTAMGKTLLNNSQLTNQFQQELGTSYSNALAMRNELNNAAAASGDLFINSEKLQKSFFALAENTGVFFDLTSKSAETFTNLTERIGLAGQEAGNLTMLLRLQGKDTETTMSNLVGTANAALATSKSTASVKQILGDVASSSKGLQASFAANPGALAKAAVAARELGATLKDIEGTQKSLLNFESSIGAELEAELVTGKQLNLERARAAALNNDLETVSKELNNQGVDLASFSNMNFIQQEKIAAAMGMSRDVMADMLLKQQTQNMTADEVRAKFGDQTYEQFKALSAQDKFNAGVAKLKDLFGSVMTALTPIIDGIAMLIQPIAFVAKLLGKLNELTGGFSNALIGVAIAAKALGMSFGTMFNPATYTGFFKGLLGQVKGISFGGIGDRIKGAFTPSSTNGFFSGLKDRFKGLSSPLKGLKDKLMGVFGGAADASKGIQFDPRMAGGGRFRDMTSGRMVSEEAANAAGVFKPGTGPTAAAASGATDAAGATGATPAPADDGKALKEKMQNIAEGIKSFADMEVVKGALAMVIAAPGLIALGIASLPLKITEKINGKALQASMKGIANGLKAFANPQVVLGGLALIPISLALATMAVGAIGLGAIALLGAPAAAGMAALTAGLTALGTAAATGVPFLGVALIGAFGLALIPFGAALGMAAPAIEAIGTVIASTIMAIADAVVTVIPALTQSLIDLSNNVSISGLLGLAVTLPLLASGLTVFGAALIPIGLASIGLLMVGKALKPIAEIAPKLNLANTAIKGIATSIALLATSLNTLDAAKLETLSDFEGNINISTVTTSNIDQASVATNTVDTTTAATTTSNVNTTDQASIATNVATNTVDQANTIASTVNEPVSSLANLITKQNAPDNTEIIPGISATTPPPTTTQEALTTNTENLATTTSNATTSLEEFTAKVNASNLTERTKQQFIDVKTRSLGIEPEVEIIDLDTKNTTTSTVDQSSVASNTTTSIVDQPSILPPSPTVTQENLVTSTKNLSTSTSEAAIELERFVEKINNTNASEFAKRTAIDMKSRALGIKPEIEVIDLDAKEVTEKQVTNELTPEIPVSIPTTSIQQENLITSTKDQATATNVVNSTNEIVPGISVTTPPTTTTQETLTTNTENLSTSTSNAVTELETFTEKINSLNISESTKQTAIKAKANALGVNPYTEAGVIDLDAKKVTNEIVQDIPVTIPPSTTTQEVLTTNTENLATTTSNATTSLEEFTAKVNTLNLSESTKSKVIETKSRALGIKPEIEVIDLDAKNIIEKLVPSAPTDTPLNVPQQSTELVPGISVNTPDPETTTISSLERVLTLNTNEINTAIGLLNETQTNRSINTDTLDILKAKAALVDLRDGQQDIPSEKFSPKSLEIVEKVVNTIVKLGTNTELQQIGEKIGGAEITNTNTIDGSNKSESVRFFKAQESSFSVVEPKTQKVETSTSDIFNNTTGTQETSNNTIQQGITAEEVEGIVSTTIKNLVPEMVAALNNIKVVNDNFNNSKQSEGPSRNRNIVNNNFA